MKRSAGLIPLRRVGDGWLLLMLRCGNYWDFPKGQLEDELEDEESAAFRETQEETGIKDAVLVVTESGHYLWWETESYGKPSKTARYFIAITWTHKIILPISPELGKPEHDEYRWLTFDEAERLPLRPRIRKVLNWTRIKMEHARMHPKHPFILVGEE